MKKSIRLSCFQPTNNQTKIEPAHTIPVQVFGRVLRVSANEITHLEGEGNYTFLCTTAGKRYLVSKSLKVVRQILGDNFLRIHKSYMVNIDYIVSRQISSIQLTCGKSIPIARRRITETQSILADL